MRMLVVFNYAHLMAGDKLSWKLKAFEMDRICIVHISEISWRITRNGETARFLRAPSPWPFRVLS